jgi:hypothetical protein
VAAGPDVSRLSPSDAVAALRSFPRRFRAALALLDDEDDEVLHRARPDGLSAVDHVDAAGRGLGAAADAVVAVLDRDRPAVSVSPGDAGPGGAVAGAEAPAEVRAQARQAALDRVTVEAEALADRAARADPASWARTGVAPGGGELSALDLLREGVRAAAVHLAAAARSRTT